MDERLNELLGAVPKDWDGFTQPKQNKLQPDSSNLFVPCDNWDN